MGHVHATQDDGVVAALSESVGGPVGDHAGPSRWWTPLRVLLGLTAVAFALGLVSKTSCVVHQWDEGPTLYAHVCTSTVADSYTGTGLVELAWPWSNDEGTRERYPITEEPALVGAWTYVAARITHRLAGSPDVEARYQVAAATLADDPDVRRERVIYTAVNAVGLALVALLATAALSRVHRRRPWDAAGFAVAPLLVFSGSIGWDLLAVAAVAGACLAWSRRRPVLAGALVGVGAAAGFWPFLLLAAFLLASLRGRRLVDVLPATVTAVATWALLNAPAFLTGRAQWDRFWSVAVDRVPDGSVWEVLTGLSDLSDSAARVGAWVLIAFWVAGVAALAVVAPRPPRVSQVALLLVAGVLLLRVSYEPQQALWLLPLAALARPRWRDLLLWQSGELAFLALHTWWVGGQLATSQGAISGPYWLGIALHAAGTGWLVAMVVRDVMWPGHDPVRDEEIDDGYDDAGWLVPAGTDGPTRADGAAPPLAASWDT